MYTLRQPFKKNLRNTTDMLRGAQNEMIKNAQLKHRKQKKDGKGMKNKQNK